MMLATETIIQILQGTWWIGAVAFAISLVITPVVRFIAYRSKIVDRPDDLLKPHGRPVAYLGGVAMCVGLLAGLAAYATTIPNPGEQWAHMTLQLAGFSPELFANPVWQLLAIGASCVLITVIGLLDDILDIRPKQKVLGQVAAAAVLLLGGIGHRMAEMFFRHLHIPAPPTWAVIALSGFICVVVVIAACNATNLLDGLDGLCGGVTGIVAVGFLILAAYLASFGHFEGTTDQLRVGLSLAMAGAVLGFLPYNVPPASIFMGDAGSMLLGFFVATMMALFTREGHARFFIAACVVFALPILDTALAVVRRLIAGKSIFSGDRSHLYDQLVDRGMTVKQVVVLFYCLAGIAAITGVWVAVAIRTRYAIILYAILLAIIWFAFYKLGMLRPEKQKSEESKEAAEEICEDRE